MRDARVEETGTPQAARDGGLEYSASVTSLDHAGRPFHCYDSGRFTPYCVEGLLDMLADEIGARRGHVRLTLELFGPCDSAVLDRVCRQFEAVAGFGAHVEIRAACGVRRLPAAHG